MLQWIYQAHERALCTLSRTPPPPQVHDTVRQLQRSLAKQFVEDHGRIWPDILDQPYPEALDSNGGEGAKYESTIVEYVSVLAN